MQFQFLLVRLKVGLTVKAISEASLFQFLLVRLKEAVKLLPIQSKGISIPTGAIKSKQYRQGYI